MQPSPWLIPRPGRSLLSFFQQKRYKKILGFVLVANLVPTVKCILDGLNLVQYVRPAPLDFAIVIGIVPMLLHFHKSVSDQVEMFQ